MKRNVQIASVIAVTSLMLCSTATAEETRADKVCSFRPSVLLGDSGATAVAGSGAVVAGAGIGAKAAGFYTLTHAATGATMLGSTAGGASAAGTVGIMGGTGAGIGSIVAFVTAPATIIAAAVTAVAVACYEGACYFADERITEFDEVLAMMQNISENSDPERFITLYDEENSAWMIRVLGADGFESYKVENLYVVNGVLMHRDWFKNTTIGNLNFILPASSTNTVEETVVPQQ